MQHQKLSDSSDAQHLQVNRRSAIGTLSVAGLGLIASANLASAFTSGRRDDSPRVVVADSRTMQSANRGAAPAPASAPADNYSDLPQEWLRRNASIANEYHRYLSALRLKRLTPHQVIAAHAKERNGVWNTLPPKAWWNRMGYTLRVVDRIAVQLNMPVEEIVSAYRSPAYNSRCEGAKSGSWHQANVAVDVKFDARPSVVTSTARNLRDRGLFKGGVGGYSGFTHIDTRGENINW